MVLQARSVTKVYGKKPNEFKALSRVNLQLKDGESVAIIGKSGSGKSTLMHVLAALDSPTEGAVLADGQDLSQLKPAKLDQLRNRTFGFIFQQFFLNGRQSVLENVALPLKIAGIGPRARKRRAMEALTEVDLADKAGNKATNLSGGQKQRACIARALVGEPKIIFADEPTGNLDTENGKRVVDLLFKLNREKGITLVIVTHDEDLAALCRRRLTMKDGQLMEAKK